MTIYTVHAPAAAGSPEGDPEALVFIKEGFCWPALLFNVFWLAFRRLWLVLIGYLLIAVALSALDYYSDGPLLPVISVLFALLFATEANQLRRWTLERNGWRMIAVVEGGDQLEAERRFFAEVPEILVDRGGRPAAAAPPQAPPSVPPQPVTRTPVAQSKPGDEVIGLFPSPGS